MIRYLDKPVIRISDLVPLSMLIPRKHCRTIESTCFGTTVLYPSLWNNERGDRIIGSIWKRQNRANLYLLVQSCKFGVHGRQVQDPTKTGLYLWLTKWGLKIPGYSMESPEQILFGYFVTYILPIDDQLKMRLFSPEGSWYSISQGSIQGLFIIRRECDNLTDQTGFSLLIVVFFANHYKCYQIFIGLNTILKAWVSIGVFIKSVRATHHPCFRRRIRIGKLRNVQIFLKRGRFRYSSQSLESKASDCIMEKTKRQWRLGAEICYIIYAQVVHNSDGTACVFNLGKLHIIVALEWAYGIQVCKHFNLVLTSYLLFRYDLLSIGLPDAMYTIYLGLHDCSEMMLSPNLPFEYCPHSFCSSSWQDDITDNFFNWTEGTRDCTIFLRWCCHPISPLNDLSLRSLPTVRQRYHR